MMPRLLPAALSAAACLAAATLRAELPQYSITPLDETWVPAGYLVSGLNNSGQVQSYDPASITGMQALRDGAGLDQTLNAPPPGWHSFFTATRGNLTNGGGTAVSVFALDSQGTIGIGDFASGTIQTLAGTPPNGDDDWSPRISDNGSFVAIQAGPDRGMLEPFLYDGANGWQPLGNLVAGGDGRPLDVNASGTVVGRTGGAEGGTVPFYYTMEAGMTAITNGGAAVFGEAAAVNNAGLVTGTANGRAFFFNGATLEFTFLSETVIGVRGVDINNAGTILGVSGSGNEAFTTLWTEEIGLVSLSSLILGNEDPFDPEWLVKESVDINDDGWILGTAVYVPDGTFHQVLLRPIPEPSAALLILAAAAFLGRRGRKRRAAQGLCDATGQIARSIMASTRSQRIVVGLRLP